MNTVQILQKGMKQLPHFKLGADPELALYDKQLERIVPANGLVPGTKDKPYRLSNGTLQIDGTAIEVGPDPARTADEFVNNLKSVMSEVRGILGERYELRVGDTIQYTPEDYEKLPPEVWESGCDPDYTFASRDGNVVAQLQPRSTGGRIDPLRVPLGGHLHLGFTEGKSLADPLHLLDCRALCGNFRNTTLNKLNTRRTADLALSSSNVRIKSYGVEYRVLSPFWLHSERTARLMFDAYLITLCDVIRSTGANSLIRGGGTDAYYKEYCEVSEYLTCYNYKQEGYQGTLPVLL